MGREPCRRLLRGLRVQTFARRLEPTSEPEGCALWQVGVAERVYQPLVERLRGDREQRPAAAQRPLVQAIARCAAHRVGQIAGIQALLENLGPRLGAQALVDIHIADQRPSVETRGSEPAAEIIEMRQLRLHRRAQERSAAAR